MEFKLEKLEKKHTPLLLAWFTEPHVKKYWPVPEEDETIQKFLQRIRSKNTFGFMVKVDEKFIGYIQYYYIDRTNEKPVVANQPSLKLRRTWAMPGTAGLPRVYPELVEVVAPAVSEDWLPKLPETTVGTDQFIGNPDYLHKGYGTQFIKEFLTYLRTIELDITTVIVDPDPTNVAAIRCYEKVGFKRAGIYTAPWGLALLMRYDFN